MTLRVNLLELDEFTTDPSPVADGSVWYNSTEQVVKVQNGGVAVPIEQGALPPLPGDVTGVGTIVYSQNGSTFDSVRPIVTRSGLIYTRESELVIE